MKAKIVQLTEEKEKLTQVITGLEDGIADLRSQVQAHTKSLEKASGSSSSGGSKGSKKKAVTESGDWVRPTERQKNVEAFYAHKTLDTYNKCFSCKKKLNQKASFKNSKTYSVQCKFCKAWVCKDCVQNQRTGNGQGVPAKFTCTGECRDKM